MNKFLWPNPAPRRPFSLTLRIVPHRGGSGVGPARVGETHFHIDTRPADVFIVIDGEPLTDLLNRAYWLGREDEGKQTEELAVELAADALKELAAEARQKKQ